MVPLDLPWYRRLLSMSLGLGLVAGLLGLGYLAITGVGIDFIFGEAKSGVWTGEWWWILVVAGGGLAVAALRSTWSVHGQIPGAVDAMENAKVDHRTAPAWVALSVVSLITGASLGPSFALVIMGGALGSWVAQRRWAEGHADRDYTLTGMAGALGGVFTSPILGSFLVSELAPTPRTRYVAAFIPQLVAATIGFVVFYMVIGNTFIGLYRLPPYRFELIDLLVAAALGVLAAAVMTLMAVIAKVFFSAANKVKNPYFLGAVGGAAIGAIAFALPATLGSGNSQLEVVLEQSTVIATGTLVLILVAKMLAVGLSVSSGFLGGNVFPMIFIGGTAGVVVHAVVPDVPLSLAVAAMMAAVPGAYLRAPISLTLIAAITVRLGPLTMAPVAVAVVTAYLLVAIATYSLGRRRGQHPADEPNTKKGHANGTAEL